MAIIYECDGCGDEIRDSRKISEVTIGLRSDNLGQTEARYHLCAGCEKRVAERANPTRWDRINAVE